MEYDVVETSDIEELEELRAPFHSTKFGVDNAYMSDNQHSPRKRVKLFHSSLNTDDLLPLTPSFWAAKGCQHGSQLLANPTVPTSSLAKQGSVKCSPTPMPQSTPPKTTPDSMPSSPLTMLGSPQVPTIQRPTSTPPGLSPPDNLDHRGSHESDQPRTDEMPVCDLMNVPRYPLRRRQPVQLHPYFIDKLHYKQALQNNPEAIITVRSPGKNRRGPLDAYEDEENETQDTTNSAVDGADRNRRRSADRTGGPGDSHAVDPEDLRIKYTGILQEDLSTTDEEEGEELRALSKEAREVLRKRKRTHKKVVKNTKAYPLANMMGDNELETMRDPIASDVPRALSGPLPPSTIASDEQIIDKDFPRNATPLFNSSSPHPHQDQVFSLDITQWDSRHTDHDFIQGTARSSDDAVGSDHSQDSHSDVSELPSKSGKLTLDKKRLRALNRMMPTSMIKNLIHRKESKRPPQKRQSSLTDDSDDAPEGPLLPGHTRARKKAYTRLVQEIRGDPESSNDDKDMDEHETSSSEVEIAAFSTSLQSRMGNHEVITLSDSENDTDNYVDEKSDEDIADEVIQAYMDEDNHAQNDVRESNLIDWMLSRTRTIRTGTKHHSTRRNRRPRKKKYAFDIVTHGARQHGKGKQTLLSFDKQINISGHRGGRGFRPVPTANDKQLPDAFQVMSEAANQLGRKEKAKQRRAHRRANGLYVFSGEQNTRIASGRHEISSFSVDIESNAPGRRSWADAFQPHKSTSLDRATMHQPEGTRRNFNPHARNQRRDIASGHEEDHFTLEDDVIPPKTPVKTSIRLLPVGISFGDETYIGKHRLDQLISVLSMTSRAPQPASCNWRGFDLHSEMGCDNFLATLQRICNGFLEFSTELPEVDHAEQLREWDIIAHVICQMLSWFYETGDQDARERLQRAVEKNVNGIVDHIQELNLKSKSLDSTVLQLNWFTVELLARAGCTVSLSESNTVTSNVYRKALSLLVDHVMELDALASVDAVKYDKLLNCSTLHQQCAELWVCLVHLLGAYPTPAPSTGTKLFWSLVLTSLQKREEQSNLKASEKVWETIFCLSALSQFSVYGITTSLPRLPAAWDLVVFAMKKIRLTADPVSDQDMRTEALILRDRYICGIILRCFRLCDKWQWQLDNASGLFNELGEIFRSRKFANLRHEKPDCPKFMLSTDWSRLSQRAKTDSAFTLFLKLIVRVAKPEQPPVELSPKVKKLLSLAIPVGSLPFTKTTPPSQMDLSMLFNRYSAVAIGIYLDKASYRTRVSHARTYVAFVNADISSRMAVIRGMMNLANLSKQLDLPLDTMTEWIADISAALSDELKAIPMPQTELQMANQEQQKQQAVRYTLHMCIQMLLSSIRHILNLYMENREYPETTLISSLKPLFTNTRISNERTTMHELERLTMILLDARSNALPPPERPAVAIDVNSESQDEYNTGFDFDFNDPNLIAALGDTDLSATKANEDKLYHAINDTNLYWLCWRHLTKFIQEIDEQLLTAGRMRLIDNRIYCWLGCGDLLVRIGKKPWSFILGQRDNVWMIKSEALRRRVDLGVAMQLLKLHPMIYSTHVDMFLDVFLESLAAQEQTIEHEYASLLLTIDGLRHPLFQGLTEPGLGDYNFSIPEYSSLKLPFLQAEAILHNLNRILDHGIALDSAFSSHILVGYCIKGFSTMRSISSSLARGSQAHKSYIKWCKQVFEFVQELEHIRSHERLVYWMSWGRSL